MIEWALVFEVSRSNQIRSTAFVNAQYIPASMKSTKEQAKIETRSDQKYSSSSCLSMSAIGGDRLIGSEYITNPIQVYVPADKL